MLWSIYEYRIADRSIFLYLSSLSLYHFSIRAHPDRTADEKESTKKVRAQKAASQIIRRIMVYQG